MKIRPVVFHNPPHRQTNKQTAVKTPPLWWSVDYSKCGHDTAVWQRVTSKMYVYVWLQLQLLNVLLLDVYGGCNILVQVSLSSWTMSVTRRNVQFGFSPILPEPSGNSMTFTIHNYSLQKWDIVLSLSLKLLLEFNISTKANEGA